MSWFKEQIVDGAKTVGGRLVDVIAPATIRVMQRSRGIRAYMGREEVSYSAKWRVDDAFRGTEQSLEVSGLRAAAFIGLLSCPASYGNVEAALAAGGAAVDWLAAYILCKGLEKEILRKYQDL